ncbi:sperm acrosome membrane-associated protein 1 [Grus americana]|nr:sperm acrosome membrane-associated protein 1 [Grus americana]
MALRTGGTAGWLAPLLPLLLALLAAGAVTGSSAEGAEPLDGRTEAEAPLVPATSGPRRALRRRGSSSRGLNASVSSEVEFGVCTVTCGIGIREVLLTSGCPGTEEKCIVRVEECQGPVDCGWGIPISEGLSCVKMPCIYMPPENRFKFVWKMITPNQTAHILPNDSAIMEACRDIHLVTFQCETQENGNTIASVKYAVYATTEMQTKKSKRIETGQSRTEAVLVFCLVTGIIVTIGVIFAMIFMILHWAVVKSIWESKFGQGNQEKKLANKRSLHNME